MEQIEAKHMGKKIKHGLFDYECQKCDQRVSSGAKYCENCGIKFEQEIVKYQRYAAVKEK